MSYFTEKCNEINSNNLKKYFDDLSSDDFFHRLVTFDGRDKESFFEKIKSLKEIISVISSLSTESQKRSYFIRSENTSNGCQELNFSAPEMKFIDNFSIPNRYLSSRSDRSSANGIVEDGLISDYINMCVLVGICTNGSYVAKTLTLNQKEDFFNNTVLTYYGGVCFPKNSKKILRHLEKFISNLTIYGDDSLRVNFIQKIAIVQHGYQYIQLGNLLSANFNHQN